MKTNSSVVRAAESKGASVLELYQLQTTQRRFCAVVEYRGEVARAESTSREAAIARATSRCIRQAA